MRKMFTFKVESSSGKKIVAIWKCVCHNAIENCSFGDILFFTSNLTCQFKLLVMQNCSILVHASLFHFFYWFSFLILIPQSSCQCDLLKMAEGCNSLVVDVVQWRLWTSHPLLLELCNFVVVCLKSIRSFNNVICMKQCSLQLCKMELCNWIQNIKLYQITTRLQCGYVHKSLDRLHVCPQRLDVWIEVVAIMEYEQG